FGKFGFGISRDETIRQFAVRIHREDRVNLAVANAAGRQGDREFCFAGLDNLERLFVPKLRRGQKAGSGRENRGGNDAEAEGHAQVLSLVELKNTPPRARSQGERWEPILGRKL